MGYINPRGNGAIHRTRKCCTRGKHGSRCTPTKQTPNCINCTSK